MRASRRRITKTAFPGELERAARGVAACSMRTARTRRSPSSRTPNAYGNGSHWRRDRRHRAARRPSPNPGARAIAAGAPTAATRRPLVCGKNHGEGFEHRGVLEGFDQAKLADVAPVRGRRRACGGSGSPHAMRAASRSVSTKAPSTAARPICCGRVSASACSKHCSATATRARRDVMRGCPTRRWWMRSAFDVDPV